MMLQKITIFFCRYTPSVIVCLSLIIVLLLFVCIFYCTFKHQDWLFEQKMEKLTSVGTVLHSPVTESKGWIGKDQYGSNNILQSFSFDLLDNTDQCYFRLDLGCIPVELQHQELPSHRGELLKYLLLMKSFRTIFFEQNQVLDFNIKNGMILSCSGGDDFFVWGNKDIVQYRGRKISTGNIAFFCIFFAGELLLYFPFVKYLLRNSCMPYLKSQQNNSCYSHFLLLNVYIFLLFCKKWALRFCSRYINLSFYYQTCLVQGCHFLLISLRDILRGYVQSLFSVCCIVQCHILGYSLEIFSKQSFPFILSLEGAH